MNQCTCKNASNKNSCQGRPDCYLRPGHPERKSEPGKQDIREWHNHFLWFPAKIYGRWYWLRTAQRKWFTGLYPLNDAPPISDWLYSLKR